MKIKYIQTKKENDLYAPIIVDYYHMWDLRKTIIRDNQKTTVVFQDYHGLEELIRDSGETIKYEKEFNLDNKIVSELVKSINKQQALAIEINMTIQTIRG